MHDLTGQHFSDQYILQEMIGSGGMADVYKAWDSVRAITMAIKVLHPELSHDRRVLGMFEKEAKILMDFGHPNIARLYEFRRHQDYHYLVLEWIDGQSLDKILKKKAKPLSLDEVSTVLLPVTSALHYLHNQEHLHCDIKPANILIAKNKKIYLTDMGVARSFKSSSTGGTPPYMAPEQFQSGALSKQTDIYSLGITVFELLSGGVLPFRGNSTHSQGSTLNEKIAWEHINLPLPPLNSINRTIPEGVCHVVTKALGKRAEERYQSANDFFNEYEKAKINVKPSISNEVSQGATSAATMLMTGLHEIADGLSGAKPQPAASKPLLNLGIDQKYKGKKRLIGLAGEYKDKIILIQYNQLTMGRNNQMQVRFSDRHVSRMHATIFRTVQGVFIQDNNSATGTYVNGRRVNGQEKLRNRDVIKIGYNDVLVFRDN
jgi:eukaryotic-like serine/threonine-protein kinase